MNRIAVALALSVVLASIVGCAPARTTDTPAGGTTTASEGSPPAAPGSESTSAPSIMVGKTRVFEHVTKTYDPARYPKAAMDGEPSRIPFFKPVHDEGVVNRDYPTYSRRTFKFLALPGAAMIFPPQGYDMFVNHGGTVNAALKGAGYDAVEIRDSGHIKILPNLYLGYYDFAWVTMNVLAEYWSGNVSMNRELWRGGSDYVIVAGAFNGGISLMARPGIATLGDLAGKKVGIMNPAFNVEALLNKKLGTVGLATRSAGGDVDVEMASPGFVMNDLLTGKADAVFAWGSYAATLKAQGFKELVPWQDFGYGEKLPYEVLVVRRDILEKHPEIVQKVVQLNYDATKRAIAVGDYQKSEYASAEHYWAYFMGMPKKVADLPLDRLMNLDATPNPAFLSDVYDYMSKYGYFKTPYPLDQLVDRSFLDKVKP
jgi:ABC-type nitrate/sulfonate/bicarbonate transport system substrate-binding protein